jgi:NAD(P)H-dependent FMN reductase
MGGANALSHLRDVLRSLHCWSTPSQACVPAAYKAFDAKGDCVDGDTQKRLHAVGKEAALFAYLHTNKRSTDFLQAIEQAHVNPGGKKEGHPAP